jgi:hypothetical protein
MRLALAVPAVVAALLFPAAASAQAPAPPPDERAAAQAYADAAKRFEAAVEALGEDPDTPWLDPCERAVERIPKRHMEGAFVLMFSHGLRLVFRQLREPLQSFRTDLANVATADPVLISGRAAVRRMGRRLDALPAPGRFCPALRAWRRAGYPRSAVRKAEAELRATASVVSPGIVRKLEATAMRLRELGVSRADAEAFGGESGW